MPPRAGPAQLPGVEHDEKPIPTNQRAGEMPAWYDQSNPDDDVANKPPQEPRQAAIPRAGKKGTLSSHCLGFLTTHFHASYCCRSR